MGLVVVGLLVIGNVNAKGADTKTSTPDAAAIVKKLADAGSNANKVWATLSDKEQKAVMDYSKVATITTETTVTGGDSRSLSSSSVQALAACTVGSKTTTQSLCAKNLAGIKMWCYFQKINWGYNTCPGYITRKSLTYWGETYWPFWSYTNIGKSESGGVGKWYYRAWTQAEFKMCITTYGCITYAYPWIDQTVYGDGTAIYNWGPK